MSDQGDHNPLSGDEPDRPDEEALLRFLSQFGITPGPDGRLNLEDLMARLQPMMSAFTNQLASYGPTDSESGINWRFTRDIARKVTAATGPDPTPSAAQATAIRNAAGLADLWLDEQITFPPISPRPAAWSRAEWVENTFDTWQQLVRPVVTQLSATLGGLLEQENPDPAAGMLQPMVRAAASGMFGAQVGQALGRLATEAFSGGDIGLPLTARPVVGLLPTNIAAFGDGLDIDPSDLLLFLALRETARQRLFGAVGWLGPQLLALVEHYARGISIDPAALEQAIESQLGGSMTAEEIEQAGQAVAGSLFVPVVSPEQREVLGRLETLLALVEGWVDEVVDQATRGRMPAATQLTEMLRRRRAAGGPAEAALKALVGLELRPRRTRDAANLWAATRATRGAAARDATWDHPDLMPTAEELNDPLGFAEHGHAEPVPDDLDAELARLLEDEGGPDQA